MYSIKDMVKAGQKAKIIYYKLGELWYETESGFKFPVPVANTEEIGEATFHAEDKAIILMRYIRKHVALLEAAQKEAGWTPPYHQTGTDNPIDFPVSGG